jgi:4-amino-4-deoxy-L-arabinose transferase-like glycosyltransferase
MKVISFIKKHLAACFVLATSLVLGCVAFGDYGIAWDEPLQRDIGQQSFNYLFKGDTTLNKFKDRDYGVAVELPLLFLEQTYLSHDTRDIYRMRHFAIHLFFLLSAFAFYLLIWILYRNKPLAVCGYLMLLLSPRIYAQSFFNSKDIPFMCMFILCFLVCAIAFRDKKLRHFVLFGILSGLLINIRIMGIVIPAMVTTLVLTDMIRGSYRGKMLIRYFVYLVLTIAVVVLSWPWLWEDPAGRFRIAFSNMSKFRWDNNILMNGTFVKASAVDWKYLPQWFGLTTPVIYLLLGITGFIFLVFRFFRKPLDFIGQTNARNQLIYLACFVGPILAVIILHSVLYDGWRQMYFIYPAFLLLAIYGLSSILKTRFPSGDLPKVIILILLIASFAGTGFTMIKSHPFEDVYFNILLSKKDQYLRKTFELDYWGTSYKQALEDIVARDKSPVLKIKVANLPGEYNSYILKPEDRKRIRYVETDDQADYFITDYRWHPWDYPYPKEKKIFSITIQNSEICSAWKLH